jgi:biopolymer transport protein ExbD
MRLSTKIEKRRVKANVEMTPLIDVVFQLLIFFMLSSTFVVQTSIPIEVSESEGTEQFEQKELTITLQQGDEGPEGGGKVFVNEVEIAVWAELSTTLSELYAKQPDARVLIRPDARVPTGRTIKVMGILNTSGIRRYGVEAQAPRESQ